MSLNAGLETGQDTPKLIDMTYMATPDQVL
jgi:hypothetical protein